MINNMLNSTEGENLVVVLAMFFIYSVLGWMMESIYMSFCNKKVTNRGFLKGPICPIYGIGEFFIYRLLSPFSHHLPMVVLMGAVFATIFEYGIAQMMIRRFGCVWWDYSNKPFNYKGILCLESTLAWALYAFVEFSFLHVSIENKIYQVPHMFLALLVFLAFLVLTYDTYTSYRHVSEEEPESEENNRLRFNK